MPLITDLAYGDTSEYLAIDEGSYTIEVRAAGADANAPLWVIGDFLETVGWLSDHQGLVEVDRAWGTELATLVEVGLQRLGRRTAGVRRASAAVEPAALAGYDA